MTRDDLMHQVAALADASERDHPEAAVALCALHGAMLIEREHVLAAYLIPFIKVAMSAIDAARDEA